MEVSSNHYYFLLKNIKSINKGGAENPQIFLLPNSSSSNKEKTKNALLCLNFHSALFSQKSLTLSILLQTTHIHIPLWKNTLKKLKAKNKIIFV